VLTASDAATDVAFVVGEETAAMEAVTTEKLHNCRNYGEDGRGARSPPSAEWSAIEVTSVCNAFVLY